jgi:hypothetical protein
MDYKTANVARARVPGAPAQEKRFFSTHVSPERLRASIARYGFGHVRNALTPNALAALQAYSCKHRPAATRAVEKGTVSYQARLSGLDDFALSLLRSREANKLLTAVFDGAYALVTDGSCYTYYEPGDFLGAHRDSADGCMVTLILYLDAKRPWVGRASSGLELRIGGCQEAWDGEVFHTVPTRTGTLVLGKGSKFWHERPTLRTGERVTALTACFVART